MNRKVLILLLPLCCFLLCGCDDDSPPVDGHVSSDFASVSKQEPNFARAGVAVYSYGDSWIQNNNDSTVYIQLIRLQSGECNCDRTLWILPFGPGQVKQVYIDETNLFHIYDKEGRHMGFICTKKLWNERLR
jgi:hypothetical protein